MLFHGFIAVAPLKQFTPRSGWLPGSLFHGFIAVAPLKHWSVPFHVERNAAPLPRLHRRGPSKLCWMRPRAWASGALPRLHRRGPIEAGRCSGRQTVERTLFDNKGDGTFEDVTDRAGLGGSRGWPTSAVFADFDGDGDLDLFVCHYLHWDPDRSLPCLDPDRPGKFLCVFAFRFNRGADLPT